MIPTTIATRRSDSSDQRPVLLDNDKAYTHLTGDEFISFKYELTAVKENEVASYILVSGGYYHNLDKITGETNYQQLYKFKRKGAFDVFSREKYQQAREIAALMRKS